ncbi:ATP-dependent protease La [Spizellomyces punctatus DAOM BR117]|uniref:Lon protease homolog 2, peroxisomal n=1 Tax=Spizellomyces punctatus (strain DAOM BR117) TaxID=645134 RepID=A0A0L0HBG1_SPIPD|nr:ATP-dependent protease La [Spizellomyces punctatus DAOM BR117]KNC98542.1 ATP-dependent protease La [Spizellomyces punctatus DAOM BR117]|eukprot:XP_016606582.1 ATP-dependent protease La [Spizellomyces punctatus DAOM BR117]
MAPSKAPEIPRVLPIIPTRNNRVLLPGIVLRLQIGRRDTTHLMDQLWLQYAKNQSIIVGCVPIKPIAKDDQSSNGTSTPTSSVSRLGKPRTVEQDDGRKPIDQSELFSWGVAARIVAFKKNSPNEARLSRATYAVTLEGIARFKIEKFVKTVPYFEAAISIHMEMEIDKEDTELQAIILNLRTSGHELANVLSQLQLPPTVLNQLRQMLDSTPPGQLADLFASMIDVSMEEKLQILETIDVKTRITRTLELLTRQIQVLKISQKLQSTVESKLGKKQREFYLRQQLDAIKKELGESDDQEEDDVADLTKRISEAKLPEEATKAAERELRRLKRMHPSMAEYQVVRTYLEWLSELPWEKQTEDVMDIARARSQLDEDHFGLEKVKTRILEYLAVRKLKQDLKGPILCFLGPPGVGKTSLGKSLANALGRKFHRISLGGVRDEAEIRGHRRTYIGALPGRIIQGLRRCGVNNPVILLDEIDKLGHDARGDPSSALLEVLDPEQNSTFTDHYLNVPFDLSNVLFIATANDADTIPGPLFDRMEVIRIPGYTFDEKLHIAKRHLLPKQIKAHGIEPDEIRIEENVLMKIATGYTREAGVRNLEREIGAVCRAMAVEYADAKEKTTPDAFNGNVTPEKLEKILGPERFDDEVAERASIPGVVTGLAWTASGSGGLLFIEATQMAGKGVLHLTGKLGDVIKESAQLGLTWVRANATRLGLAKVSTSNVLEGLDVHIHLPAGAIPKDGPSAGVTIVTALVSLFSQKPVRDHTAMTGEITLRGQVLPVGGIKEKVLAAHRGGIRRVIIPFRNANDLREVPANVRKDIEFVFAKTVDEVLAAAFEDGWKGTNKNLGTPASEDGTFGQQVYVKAKL